ncbi:hypothetical protein [Pendulispora albinea]|uniref:Crocagin biosynthetic protein CgnE/B domain-containing protein n=1 Tax=Pendulispora albinea TaxID=2741071 RepID=A0ABZ2M0P7_9BACT
MSQSHFSNFIGYLHHHPALEGLERPHVFVGFTKDYAALANGIVGAGSSEPGRTRFTSCALDQESTERAAEGIRACDLFLLLYDSSTLPAPSPRGPDFIVALKAIITEHWKKSVVFKDYGRHFEDAFRIAPERIRTLNRRLIDIAKRSSRLEFTDAYGSRLTAELLGAEQKWTDVNGYGSPDLTPGEIATHTDRINGRVFFTGTFLSTIPFAIKYGIVEEPVELVISNGAIESIATDNASLKRDLEQYIAMNESNRRVEELGIGTNEGVTKLYARNAGFEERHCGLHLGLGGSKRGSHHLDLIFATGALAFDGQKIFDGHYTL